MAKLNTVIDGEYKGTDISGLFLGKLRIGKKNINDKEVQNIEIVDIYINNKDGEHELNYGIKIDFKTGETSTILVDKAVHDKIIEDFPSSEENYLNLFLRKGYKIVGYSSDVFANSGLLVGTIIHTILLQKGLDVRQIVFNTRQQKQSKCYLHSLSEDEQHDNNI